MTRHIPALVAALAIVPIAPATGQTCTEPHYRWSEKIDTSFAHQTPADVDVSDILRHRRNPRARNGGRYGQARDQLATIVDTTHLGANGDLNAPVLVTLTGAAFFDGYHQ